MLTFRKYGRMIKTGNRLPPSYFELASLRNAKFFCEEMKTFSKKL